MSTRKEIHDKLRFILSPIIGSDEIEEIYLSASGHRSKSGAGREFPGEKKGGDSLNLSVSDGPHQFPTEKDF